MSDDPVPALLHLLASEGGVSLARAGKRLGLGHSELQRLLAALGSDPRYDGLGLVEARDCDGHLRLWLTDKGRALCLAR